MISQKLKMIFGIWALVFIAHGLEEIFSGFSTVDSQVAFWFGNVNYLPTAQATFVIFQIMFWFMLIGGCLFLLGPKWHLRMMFVTGVIFVYELHHLYKAMSVGGYYPGIATAILL